MKISQKELREMVKEALKEAKSLQKDVLPGSGELSKISKEVDDFLMETSEKAKELMAKIEEEMKVDVLGGKNPSLAPRIGERNRMLSVRAGALKKLGAACVSLFEYLRREG